MVVIYTFCLKRIMPLFGRSVTAALFFALFWSTAFVAAEGRVGSKIFTAPTISSSAPSTVVVSSAPTAATPPTFSSPVSGAAVTPRQAPPSGGVIASHLGVRNDKPILLVYGNTTGFAGPVFRQFLSENGFSFEEFNVCPISSADCIFMNSPVPRAKLMQYTNGIVIFFSPDFYYPYNQSQSIRDIEDFLEAGGALLTINNWEARELTNQSFEPALNLTLSSTPESKAFARDYLRMRFFKSNPAPLEDGFSPDMKLVSTNGFLGSFSNQGIIVGYAGNRNKDLADDVMDTGTDSPVATYANPSAPPSAAAAFHETHYRTLVFSFDLTGLPRATFDSVLGNSLAWLDQPNPQPLYTTVSRSPAGVVYDNDSVNVTGTGGGFNFSSLAVYFRRDLDSVATSKGCDVGQTTCSITVPPVPAGTRVHYWAVATAVDGSTTDASNSEIREYTAVTPTVSKMVLGPPFLKLAPFTDSVRLSTPTAGLPMQFAFNLSDSSGKEFLDLMVLTSWGDGTPDAVQEVFLEAGGSSSKSWLINIPPKIFSSPGNYTFSVKVTSFFTYLTSQWSELLAQRTEVVSVNPSSVSVLMRLCNPSAANGGYGFSTKIVNGRRTVVKSSVALSLGGNSTSLQKFAYSTVVARPPRGAALIPFKAPANQAFVEPVQKVYFANNRRLSNRRVYVQIPFSNKYAVYAPGGSCNAVNTPVPAFSSQGLETYTRLASAVAAAVRSFDPSRAPEVDSVPPSQPE